MEGPRTPLRDVTNLIRRMTMQEAPAGQQTPPAEQRTPPAAKPSTLTDDPYKVMETLEWLDALIEQHRREIEQFNN